MRGGPGKGGCWSRLQGFGRSFASWTSHPLRTAGVTGARSPGWEGGGSWEFVPVSKSVISTKP